jgi:acylphosphatase
VGINLLIRGRVQGVGFRFAFASQADELGLTGWVRNRADGTVEAVISGDATAVEAMLSWARRGPPAARVTDVVVATAEGRFDTFEIE